MDVDILSRLQFALTECFHFLFPPISIGFSLYIVFIEAMRLKTGDEKYRLACKFFLKLFGLIFAIGVITGTLIVFHFGTNCPHAKAVITSFWELFTNPSCFERIVHTIAGCWLCGAFLALCICAYYILKKRTTFAKLCAKVALVYTALSLAAIFLTGHESARSLTVNQSEKLAVFEGHYRSTQNVPQCIFGSVNENECKVDGIYLGLWLSYLAFGTTTAIVAGFKGLSSDKFHLKTYPDALPSELAKVRLQYCAPVKFCFHSLSLIIFFNCAKGALTALGFALWIKSKLSDLQSRFARWFYVCSLLAVILPIVAYQTVGEAAEVGKQPWIVWHILKTTDSATTVATAGEVLFPTIAFTVIFTLISAVFLYAFFEKIKVEPKLSGNGY